ncbi:MAG: helix-turn-helix domain-containing protein, partial [Chitinophagaceae bacterium]|nr:helix-turn-helix domain-containing protein [Chitinophagaceae bacterium]
MSASNFKILKQCVMCGNRFEAQKVSTLYCSHKCNSKHYKLKKRLELKGQAEIQVEQTDLFKPKVSALSRAEIMDKEFIRVKELAMLFTCSTKTIYSMINSGVIPAIKLTDRKTLIRVSDINRLFEKNKVEKGNILTIENCYTMEQLTKKYSVSRNTIYGLVGKRDIERIKENGITYY